MQHAMTRAILPNDMVFDIGANLGEKAYWFASRGARVIAVEPQPNLAVHLRKKFADNKLVTVIQKGVADKVGVLNMSISEAHVLSTFSEDWKKGRFTGQVWNESVAVEMTTLDDLISIYGEPRYTKIDVEGYEWQVVNGLSKKAGVLSFEFTSEYIQIATDICERLTLLGYRHFNYSVGEADAFAMGDAWHTPAEVAVALRQMIKSNSDLWGDIYAI